jgi:hypothetical protein
MLLIGLALAQDVSVGGHAAANLRLGLCAPPYVGLCPWLDFHDTAVLGGEVDARFARAADARLALDLRAHAGPATSSLEESGDPRLAQNTSLKLHDAWIGGYGRFVDWRVGSQRLNWGSADGLNPVDVLNPYDLENPTRFDERLAVPMVRGRLHNDGLWWLELAAVPWFTPALMPTDVIDVMGDNEGRLDLVDANADIGRLESRADLPPTQLSEMAFGARLFVPTRAGEFAISGYRGRDSLPQVGGELRITGFAAENDRVDVGVPITWPRVVQAGVEWRGELPADAIGWVEAVVVFPDEVEVTFNRPQLENLERLGTIDEVPDPIPSETIQDGQPYPRLVAGLDRTLGQVYLNLQYAYGFPTERTRSELNHYGILYSRWSLRPTVALEARVVTDGAGLLADAHVTRLYGDAVELTLGATWIGGPDDSALGAFRQVRHVHTGATVHF